GGQGAPPTALPTAQPTTAAPTEQPAVAATTPIAGFSQGVNVRRGPGLEFDPPIGAYAAGQTAEILAISTGGDWYKVRYGGSEGWVFAQLAAVSGDTSALPRESGPPRPTPRPATATPVLPTGMPASGANLVAGIVVLNPAAPVCAQTFVVGLDVANLGTEPTSASGTVTLNDVRAADGSQQDSTIGGFPVLQPGQTVRVDMPLTISTWYNEMHRITLTIDQENLIAESNPNDNAVSLEYFLDKGGCP
ncbi:MAG: SH3 domain-containing protein, partial [Anaerolineae bacterium]|nr:SH3 domain-containing protein [Anaerolineae bacterium]